ncbi:MAG: diacylglycerol kinase [Gammaproteobacteria bacterium]
MTGNQHKSRPGLARIWRAFNYSVDGLAGAFKNENAFRQELMLAAVMVPVVFVLPASPTQQALMLSTVLLVLVVELVNSSIEATVDRISLDNHELAKRAKDVASAAVFLSLVNCVVVWLLVLVDIYGVSGS